MRTHTRLIAAASLLLLGCGDDDDPIVSTTDAAAICFNQSTSDGGAVTNNDPFAAAALATLADGQRVFRSETFGSEAFWGDTLGLQRAIEGASNGGVGPGLTPRQALALGLRVDVEALPSALVEDLRANRVDLDSPSTTVALMQINAVVGLTGFATSDGKGLRSMGIQCALCHSTVDDSFAPGIGKRRDGWPNRDLDVGAIIALAPDLSFFEKHLGADTATVKTVLSSWGPGRFDAELILDGKAFRPDGKTAATVIPAAFGLAGVNLATYTGWGSVTHWNAFVSNLEMHGKGNFYDPRLDDETQFPLAAKARLGHVTTPLDQDRITSHLAPLHLYQLALQAPRPPSASYDATVAQRGKVLFEGAAKCATCHIPPLYSEPGWNMHTPADIGIDSFQADRAPDRRYRTTPLRGLFTRQKRGFYHDGRFATYLDVVVHYNTALGLGLTTAQQTDLAEYLKSL